MLHAIKYCHYPVFGWVLMNRLFIPVHFVFLQFTTVMHCRIHCGSIRARFLSRPLCPEPIEFSQAIFCSLEGLRVTRNRSAPLLMYRHSLPPHSGCMLLVAGLNSRMESISALSYDSLAAHA